MFSSCNEKYEYDMCNTRKAKPLQFKRGSATAFRLQNPILLEGQPAWEIDTYRLKIGDGETRYNKLPYIGYDAKNGKSAYELWLEAGNSGTEQEYLDSLKGKDGKSVYDSWLEAGNEGSLNDFIEYMHTFSWGKIE